MDKSIQPTPRPWTKSVVEFEKDEWLKLHGQKQICIAKGMDILAIVYGPNDQEEANAAHIVKCVNAYETDQEIKDSMLDTIEELLELMPHYSGKRRSNLMKIRDVLLAYIRNLSFDNDCSCRDNHDPESDDCAKAFKEKKREEVIKKATQ